MATIVCAAVMLMLLAFSDAATEAARAAAACFASGVLPSLLPMMVLGNIWPADVKTEHSSVGLWLRTALYGFAAGSPAAARRAADLRGCFEGKRWECALCLSGVMSPMFFTGTLAGWLGSVKEGRILLVIHWLGAIASALIWRLLASGDTPVPDAQSVPAARCSLPEAIARSAQPLLCVCGAMMVFSAAAGLLKSLLLVIVPAWTARHENWLTAVWAVMEIGGGSSAVIRAYQKPHALLSALCGFGGLSIWLQNLLFVQNSVRPAKLLGMRALHGAVCYALVRILNPF